MSSTEYVADVPYVRHFIADLSPSKLRLVAALHGAEPPPATDFDYCELGAGHGDTLVALAAAYPDARFLGVDLVDAHVATAKRLARDASLENVGFLARDFADLVTEDVGEFDYVVAHGVLSWVSPEKRRALAAFAQAKLKPGGILFVSYNAMPGWAAVEPLRQLLLFPSSAPGAAGGDDVLERARRGVELATAMERAGAEFFVKNPSASEMLATMTKVGLPYVVHEYMHEHWSPMYVARVAWEMAAADLHYVGSLPLHDNFRETAVPEAIEALLRTATDRLTFESLKDIALNQFFRRDVFVKAGGVRGEAAKEAYLATTPWGMVMGTPEERTVKLPHRSVELGGPIADGLYEALARGAAPLATLVARDERLREASADDLRATLLRLLVVEHVLPMTRPAPGQDPDPDARYALCSAYDQMMIRRAGTELPLVLASDVAGTAFPLSALDAIALRAYLEVPGPERERWTRAFVDRSVLRIRVGDRVLADREEQARALLETIAIIRTQRLGKLVELGILAPRA